MPRLPWESWEQYEERVNETMASFRTLLQALELRVIQQAGTIRNLTVLLQENRHA